MNAWKENRGTWITINISHTFIVQLQNYFHTHNPVECCDSAEECHFPSCTCTYTRHIIFMKRHSITSIRIITKYSFHVHTVYAIYFASLIFSRIGTSRHFREWLNSRLRRRANMDGGRRNHCYSLICTCTVYCATVVLWIHKSHSCVGIGLIGGKLFVRVVDFANSTRLAKFAKIKNPRNIWRIQYYKVYIKTCPCYTNFMRFKSRLINNSGYTWKHVYTYNVPVGTHEQNIHVSVWSWWREIIFLHSSTVNKMLQRSPCLELDLIIFQNWSVINDTLCQLLKQQNVEFSW